MKYRELNEEGKEWRRAERKAMIGGFFILIAICIIAIFIAFLDATVNEAANANSLIHVETDVFPLLVLVFGVIYGGVRGLGRLKEIVMNKKGARSERQKSQEDAG